MVRLVGLLIAIVSIGVAIWCAREAVRMNAEFHQWLVARPMQTAVDLSKPGETIVPFHQTCGVSHGQAVYLDCGLHDQSEPDTRLLLRDLDGDIVIKDADGNEIATVTFNSKTAVQYWDGRILLAGFMPFPQGEYVATIRVHSGAPGLADKQQEMYSGYELCGIEQLPAFIASVFAFAAGIIGLVAAVCVLPGLVRCGIWRNVPTEQHGTQL
jgi:hypothetical protein